MKIREFFEKIEKLLAKPEIVWLSIEEAKVWGMNLVYYTLSVEPTFMFSLLACEVDPFNEELTPIAILIVLNPEESQKITLDELNKVVAELGAFIFSYGEDIGVLIPANEPELHDCIRKVELLAQRLYGKKLNAKIDGYFLDFLHPA